MKKSSKPTIVYKRKGAHSILDKISEMTDPSISTRHGNSISTRQLDQLFFHDTVKKKTEALTKHSKLEPRAMVQK